MHKLMEATFTAEGQHNLKCIYFNSNYKNKNKLVKTLGHKYNFFAVGKQKWEKVPYACWRPLKSKGKKCAGCFLLFLGMVEGAGVGLLAGAGAEEIAI